MTAKRRRRDRYAVDDLLRSGPRQLLFARRRGRDRCRLRAAAAAEGARRVGRAVRRRDAHRLGRPAGVLVLGRAVRQSARAQVSFQGNIHNVLQILLQYYTSYTKLIAV